MPVLFLSSLPSLWRVGCFLLLRLCPIPLDDGGLQLLPPGVVHFPLTMIWRLVRVPEGDAPIQEQPQPCPHGVGAGFHHNKFTLGDGLQLVRRHKGPLHHLEGLTVLSFAPADGTGLDRIASQGSGQHIGGLAVGSEAAKDGGLAIVLDDF